MAKESASEQVERLKEELVALKVKYNLLRDKSKLSADEIEEVERDAEELRRRK